MALLCAHLWRVDCVTRHECDELTGDELTVWRDDRVATWLCDYLTSNRCSHSRKMVISSHDFRLWGVNCVASWLAPSLLKFAVLDSECYSESQLYLYG